MKTTKNVLVNVYNPLSMISAIKEDYYETIEEKAKEELANGYNCVIGISNISKTFLYRIFKITENGLMQVKTWTEAKKILLIIKEDITWNELKKGFYKR